MRFLFDGHTLDLGRRELRLGEQPVALEPLVFDLLTYLVANRDRVVSKEEVLDSVWSGRIVSESALATRIAAARRVIGDSGKAQKLIRTFARKGFRFVGAAREDNGTDASQAEAPLMPIAEAPVPRAATAETLSLPDKPSIAVLPFANMSSDPEQQYFSDGMADDIITELSQDHSLFVIARNSSFTFKGRAVDVKLVARELGVRYVLEGSVQRHGGQLRVNAQLIDAETGNHIWAERYNRAVEALFTVQDEITVAVARAVHPVISHAERERATHKPPDSLSAWEAWHRALGSLSKADLPGMRDFLQRAVALDPRFAPAHAMLAFLHVAEATRGIGSLDSAALAEAEAQTAVELDPRSGIAHAMLAWTYGHHGDWEPALEEAETAITLNPNDPWGYLSKGHTLLYSGRPAAAREPLSIALRLDPHGPTAQTVMHKRMVGCYFEGDYLAAEALARRAIREYARNPRPYLLLAAALGQLGRAEEARTALQAAIAVSPSIFKFLTDCRPPYYRPADHDHLIDGVRKAGWESA